MKVFGPLHSLGATGRFGGVVFFNDGNYARIHFTPANPQTAAQMNQRQKMSAGGQAVSRLNAVGTSVVTEFKASAVMTGYSLSQWSSRLNTLLMAKFDSSRTTFTTLSGAEQTLWDTQGTNYGMENTNLPNTTDGDISQGHNLLNLAQVFFDEGIRTAEGTPDGTNAAAWYTYLVGV